MKVKVFFILTVAMLFLSACSSSRFGHIPKGKRQKHVAKKEAREWKKQKVHQVEIEAKKPSTLSSNKTTDIKKGEVEQPFIAKETSIEKSSLVHQKKKELTKPNHKKELQITNKKAATNKQQQTTDFWEGFWGDLLAEIIAALILMTIAAFFIWLDAIGLGWLAVAIAIIILILIIVWIGGIIQDFFDMIFS